MRCIYWDGANPTVTVPTYFNGWTNSATVTVSWTANDAGGSGLKEYDIKIYRKFGAQNNPTVADFIGTVVVAAPALSYVYAPLDGYSYMFAVCPRDIALNNGACSMGTDISRIDRTPPNPASLTNTTPLNLLATTSQAFTFSYPNDG